jgi:hypothetical protein
MASQEEATEILRREVERLRGLSYSQLLDFRRVRAKELRGPSQKRYQVETESFWDGKPHGDLRVMVQVNAMEKEAISVSDDFIIGADGSFVGE